LGWYNRPKKKKKKKTKKKKEKKKAKKKKQKRKKKRRKKKNYVKKFSFVTRLFFSDKNSGSGHLVPYFVTENNFYQR